MAQNRASAAKSAAKRKAAQEEADKQIAALKSLVAVLSNETTRLQAKLYAFEHPPPPLAML